jgi:Calcineurin-like phosphoesterase
MPTRTRYTKEDSDSDMEENAVVPNNNKNRNNDDDEDEDDDDSRNISNSNSNSNVADGFDVDHNSSNEHFAIRYNDDPDTCRILLSTDNHLGYNERDSIRGMDSFAAFEEVLYLAQLYHVDFVLLAGDVFHENRPSRRTVYTTLEILRRYCMGPNPIKVQIISNLDETKTSLRSINGTVNYLDPNYSVHLPIFAIHGNHDDPSRDQGGGELLAALGMYVLVLRIWFRSCYTCSDVDREHYYYYLLCTTT